MKFSKKDTSITKSNSMLNQKTNEDHNGQKPDPKDPNQNKYAQVEVKDEVPIIKKKNSRITVVKSIT